MKELTDLDLLIIGQGLAGSAVAMQALAREYRILVLDRPELNRSSVVAAGLFNPVTGRKMVKTWMADEVFPALHSFYEGVEKLTKRKFFYPLPVYRPFVSVEEQNEWMGKSADPAYRSFIDKVSTSGNFGEDIRDPFGGIMLTQCGYLDTYGYLEAVRAHLKERNAIELTKFDPASLKIEGNILQYGHLRPKKVIFCQGVDNSENPWFKTLPVKSLKGEYLNIQSDWKNDVILNRGVYVVPGAKTGQWRVGATYNWHDQTAEITEWARIELKQKLEAIYRIPYSILDQQFGFRPTTPDRKPVIGAHPDHPSLIIFNGFGTKGVSLAPYFSEVLFRWLENEGTIGKEADVTRFN